MAAAALAIAGCGSGGFPERGLVVSGPGIVASAPPWPAQYADLAQRIAKLKLPTGDSERFHIHALLTIYDQGVLVPVAAHIGLTAKVKSTLHTHDRTGVIHMEAAKPFRYTLGDFFAVWGVRFGGGTLGSLEDSGSDRVWVYVDGKRITDPARHVLANNDNIVVAYGTKGSFPHTVGDYWLKQVEKGGKALPCAAATPTAPAKPCLAPKRSRHSG